MVRSQRKVSRSRRKVSRSRRKVSRSRRQSKTYRRKRVMSKQARRSRKRTRKRQSLRSKRLSGGMQGEAAEGPGSAAALGPTNNMQMFVPQSWTAQDFGAPYDVYKLVIIRDGKTTKCRLRWSDAYFLGEQLDQILKDLNVTPIKSLKRRRLPGSKTDVKTRETELDTYFRALSIKINEDTTTRASIDSAMATLGVKEEDDPYYYQTGYYTVADPNGAKCRAEAPKSSRALADLETGTSLRINRIETLADETVRGEAHRLTMQSSFVGWITLKSDIVTPLAGAELEEAEEEDNWL